MVSSKGKAPKLVLMDAGFLAPLIVEFACSLQALAHSDVTIRSYTDSARHFAAWVCDEGLQSDGIGKGAVDGFARHRCRCAGARQWNSVSAKYARRASRFVSFLSLSVILCAGHNQRQGGVLCRAEPKSWTAP